MDLSASTLSPATLASSRQQLLIVCDGASPDLAPLLRGGRHPLHAIAACRDPIEAITQRLHQAAGDIGVEELHLVAHGRAGAFCLGGHWIDRARLIAAATSLASWRVARIILWSCHTGADQAFLATLAELTGATVHASVTSLGVSENLSIQPVGREPVFRFSELFRASTIVAWGGSLSGSVIVNSGGLVFNNGTQITSESNNPVGTTYLYKNIYYDTSTGLYVDALVTIKGTTNADVSVFDSDTLQFDSPDFFQPNVFIRRSPGKVGGSAEFHFQFIQGGSYQGGHDIPVGLVTVSNDELRINGATPYVKVTLDNVSFTAYDIDGQSGNSTAKQFVQTQKYSPNPLAITAGDAVDTTFVETGSGLALRFTSKTTGDSDPNQGPVFDVADFKAHSATAGVGSMDSFDLTVGDSNNTFSSGSYVALFGISFGPNVPASLGDYVFLDSNANGIQDTGEAGVANVAVNLLDGSNTIIRTQQTNAGGQYLFSGLIAGTYSVQVQLPAGYAFTKVHQGSDDEKDSDANVTTGLTQPVTLQAGEKNLSLDAGLLLLASLGDRLWSDSNGNGLQDTGEAGVFGQSVTLIGGGADGLINGIGDTTASTTTDASGTYLFSGLIPGVQYRVRFSKPTETVFTSKDQGTNEAIDSDVDTSGLSQIVTLGSGENNTSVDAGLYTPASISGYVYQDLGNDGVRHSEPPIAGVSLRLTGTDGVGNSVTATTTTNAAGYYQFTGLRPGTYTISESQPVAYVDGKDTAGSPGGGSAGNDFINDIVLKSGMSSTENNFGERLLSITGYKFIDIVSDGIWGPVDPQNPNGPRDPGQPGWQMNLSVDTNMDGKLSDGDVLIASDITDSLGQYQFENLGPLKPGQVYFVWESPVPVGSSDTPDDWSRTFNSLGYYALDPSLGQSIAGVKGSSDLGVDGEGPGKGNFGNFKNLDLGCYKWIDTNGNGAWDQGEAGSNGWDIYLDNDQNPGNGYIRKEVTRNDGKYDGFYEFQNIKPAEIKGATTLYVYEENRPGYIKTFGGYTFGVQSGQIVRSDYGIAQIGNFGNAQLASLGDRVWFDGNGNGLQDTGEAGVSGLSVTLIGGGADRVIGTGGDDTTNTISTDASGTYLFSGLMPGVEYQVQFGTTAGTVFTVRDQGSNDAIDSDADAITGKTPILKLNSGENNMTLDAGLISANPGIQIIKDLVGPSLVAPNTPVTFSYSVTNTGGVPLTDIAVIDDNATSDFVGDDFKPVALLQTSGPYIGKNIGDLNGDNKLDLAEVWKYSASVIPPVVMTVTVTTGSTPIDSGVLSYQTLSNGDIRVYYRQSNNFNDNTYGTGSDAGWTSQGKTHKFSDLTGSDKAGFLIKYSDGTTLAQFYQDYITASTTQDKALDPITGLPTANDEYAAYSGYRSLGWSGGDGSWVSGSTTAQSWIKDFDSTLETNLNQSGLSNAGTPYTATIVNSPISDANWDVVDGYSFVISAKAFTTTGKTFGGVTIFDQHNSPAKVGGSNTYIPDIQGGASVNTATVTGIGNATTLTDSDDATVVVVTGPLGSIGDRVWFDTDADGVQDSGEAGIAAVKLTLIGDFNKDGNPDYTATAITDASGAYGFKGLPAGVYTVTVDASSVPATVIETYDLDGLATQNVATAALGSGQIRTDFDFGYVAGAPGFSLVKTANKASANYGEPITYTYVAKNNGSQALTNVVLKDDNGTPSDPADDFTLSSPSGDTTNPGSLDPGETWTYVKTLIPAISLAASNVNGYTGPAGQLSYQTLSNGDIRVTYRQSTTVNDNTYGTGISSGWSSHTFSDLTGSDKAGFELKDKNGATVMKFYMDYISASSSQEVPGEYTAYSGYRSLGGTGGDGSLLVGSATNLYDFDSTLELNLNRAGYTTMTTNSPVNDSNWDAVDGYSFTVKASAFGSVGFGSATIFDQHNSPSKLGVNSFVPTPTLGTVTNTAVVTAQLAGASVVAIDDATVTIGSGSSGATKFFVTDNTADQTFLYSSLGGNTGSFAHASGNGDARDPLLMLLAINSGCWIKTKMSPSMAVVAPSWASGKRTVRAANPKA